MVEDQDLALALALSMEMDGVQQLGELQTAALQRVTVSEGRPGGVSLLKQLSSGSFEYDELEVCLLAHEYCLTSSQLQLPQELLGSCLPCAQLLCHMTGQALLVMP